MMPKNGGPDWAGIRKVLVIRLDNMGDVLMCTPALRAIEENPPQARVTLLASPGGTRIRPLLADIDNLIAERVGLARHLGEDASGCRVRASSG